MIRMTGRNWAYVGLFLGLSASITANVASTVLAESDISLVLRVPFAVIWPVLTYIAIEVLTRTDWRRSASHILIRAVISVPVAAVAAFVSYLHQHELMILAGEPGLAQLVGPLAVDGMLFGMTATLIVTRAKAARFILGFDHAKPIGPMPAAPLVQHLAPQPAPIVATVAEPLAEEPTLPISVSPAAPRALRSVSWDARAAAELAVDGAKAAEIVSKVQNMSPATAGLFVRVATLLRADPAAEIPAKVTGRSVNPEYVRIMREMIAR